MSFVSLAFFVLLLIVLPLYYLLPHRARWVLLLAASWFFYAYFDFLLIFLLLFTTLVSYAAALCIGKSASKRTKKAWMAAAVIACLGSLVFFKYTQFLLDSALSLCRLFGARAGDIELNIILPVGISFYTFQTLSYVLDVYRGTMQAERHFGYYALFVSFFPQLVAGPIEKASNLLPQLKEQHFFEWESFREGAAVMAGGFVKKVAIADMLAAFVNSVYNVPDLSGMTSVAVFAATALFLVQVYCDFSGYSDIAVGCAQMMGVRLMQNFNKPFSAQTVTEFWSRWHISLSNWFNEYVYLPLAYRTLGKKHLNVRHCMNIVLVMLLCGLWHGANWTYVVWGLVIGLFQIADVFLRRLYAKKRRRRREGFFFTHLRMVTTFLLLLVAMVFFRADTLSDAFALFGRFAVGWGFTPDYFALFASQTQLTLTYAVNIVLGLVLLKFVDDEICMVRGRRPQGRTAAVQYNIVLGMVWLIAAAWCFLAVSGQSAGFIYFQF